MDPTLVLEPMYNLLQLLHHQIILFIYSGSKMINMWFWFYCPLSLKIFIQWLLKRKHRQTFGMPSQWPMLHLLTKVSFNFMPIFINFSKITLSSQITLLEPCISLTDLPLLAVYYLLKIQYVCLHGRQIGFQWYCYNTWSMGWTSKFWWSPISSPYLWVYA